MNVRARLSDLEAAAESAGACPDCGAGGDRVVLLPIRCYDDGEQVTSYPACARCGVKPARVLLPVRLDGDRRVTA